MSVGGVAPVEGVSVGGGTPVEVVSVGGGTLEVLLTEKQGIVTVKMDLPKMVPQNYFFENFLELISYCKILPLNIWTTSKRNNEDSFTRKIWTLSISLCQLKEQHLL